MAAEKSTQSRSKTERKSKRPSVDDSVPTLGEIPLSKPSKKRKKDGVVAALADLTEEKVVEEVEKFKKKAKTTKETTVTITEAKPVDEPRSKRAKKSGTVLATEEEVPLKSEVKRKASKKAEEVTEGKVTTVGVKGKKQDKETASNTVDQKSEKTGKGTGKETKKSKHPPIPVPEKSEQPASVPQALRSSKVIHTILPLSKKSKNTAAKQPPPPPEAVLSDDEVARDDADSEGDEEVHLHGFSTDEDDSSDDEVAMDFEPSSFDVEKLPTIAKDDATVKRRLDKAKREPTEDRGVLYLGRLPHGFFEDQMKAYFSQFGTVTRIRLSRNKKNGRSKHYGFVEFESSAVAQIVADTMDNYLIMGHILRCKLIPKDEVHAELWVGANRKWRPVPRDRVTRVEHNRPRTEDEQARIAKRLIKRQNDRKRKLSQAGIKYNFETVSYKKSKESEA